MNHETYNALNSAGRRFKQISATLDFLDLVSYFCFCKGTMEPNIDTIILNLQDILF